MMSRAETDRLKRCYLKGLRKSGVLLNILPSLAEISTQEIAKAIVGMVDEATRDEKLRWGIDPDLSVCLETVVEEINRLRTQGAARESL